MGFDLSSGVPFYGYVPQGHWKTTTFASELRLTVMTGPLVCGGAMNGALFVAYVHQVLWFSRSRVTRTECPLAGPRGGSILSRNVALSPEGDIKVGPVGAWRNRCFQATALSGAGA